MIRTALVFSLVTSIAGCGGPQQPVASSLPAPQVVKSPIEYQILETDETPHNMGPQVVLTVETTNDVAKKSTRDDLIQFWKSIRPTLGNRRVFIYLKTPVPGVDPWGVITRLNLTGKWQVEVTRNEYGIDAEPYYFVDKIDRSKPNQGAMILTLPVVNRIIERLTRARWKVMERQEDFLSAESGKPFDSFTLTMTPESMSLDATGKDVVAFTDTVVSIVDEFGISEEVKTKLQSVFGSPEYVRAIPGEPAPWQWTIGDYFVTYYHVADLDQLDVDYAN